MADLKLYFYPLSFYSQKALMALYEKEAIFREQIILLSNGDHVQPWYMRITPKGTIPALDVGDRVLTDSEDIAEYLDRELDTGIKLIPDPQTKIGKDVWKWRQLFNALKIDVITYGILYHRELSMSGVKMPKILLKWMKKSEDNMKAGEQILRDKADKYPDLREAYLVKLQIHTERVVKMTDRQTVCQYLDDLDKLFDQIESKLADTRNEQGVSDSWLVGPRYTMADINLAILIDRLVFLGLEGRYFPQNKRPLVYDYYVRMGMRRSVQNVRKQMGTLPRYFMMRFIKKALPVTVGVVALAVGIAYWRK